RGPRGVVLHRTAYRGLHTLRVGVEREGAMHRLSQRVRGVGVEAQAGASVRMRVHITHRVGESARRVYHGKGTVAHGDELPQPARLELAGHQEEVGSGIDAMRERVVEADTRADIARGLREFAEELLVV